MTQEKSTELGIALLRVGLGVVFIAHGLLKLLVFTPAGTVGFFAGLGLPAWFAWAVMLGEILAGVVLITGAYTRLVALALLPIILGATWVHFGNGWVFSSPNGGWEFPAFLTLAVIVQALVGSGAFALSLPSLASLFSANRKGKT